MISVARLCPTRSHDAYAQRGIMKKRELRSEMTFDMVDVVWSTMGSDSFYSPSDLSNSLGRPTHEVTRVLEFLTKYGFTERVTRREMIFRKIANPFGPDDALRVLQTLLEDTHVSDAGKVASVSKIN